jgi:hypothetical protein
MSQRFRKWMLLENVALMIFSPPFINYRFTVSGSTGDDRYTIDDILTIAMFIRSYTVFVLIASLSR